MSNGNLYCKVFVDAPVAHDALRTWIAQKVRGRERLFDTVESSVFSLDVMTNDEADARESDDPDVFLFYRYFLDVEPTPGTDRDSYVRGIAELLVALWDKRWPAVAACDFEDELPYSGGYSNGRLTMPVV